MSDPDTDFMTLQTPMINAKADSVIDSMPKSMCGNINDQITEPMTKSMTTP